MLLCSTLPSPKHKRNSGNCSADGLAFVSFGSCWRRMFPASRRILRWRNGLEAFMEPFTISDLHPPLMTRRIWRKPPINKIAFPPNTYGELFMSFTIRLTASKKCLLDFAASSQSIKSTTYNFLPSSEGTETLQVLPWSHGIGISNIECAVRPP